MTTEHEPIFEVYSNMAGQSCVWRCSCGEKSEPLNSQVQMRKDFGEHLFTEGAGPRWP